MMLGSPKAYVPPKPSMHITDSDMPEIKDMKVGKKYHLKLHVKMVHHSEGSEYGSDPKRHSARFEIHSCKSDGSDSADTD